MERSIEKVRERLATIRDERGAVGYLLLWLIGVPIPILILLYLIFR